MADNNNNNNPLKLQLMSDLHLEFPFAFKNFDGFLERGFDHTLETFPVKGDIMCLLGDIGSPWKPSYQDLIYDMSEKYSQVIVVPGNHEYYSTRQTPCTYTSTQKKMEEICNAAPKKNVIFGHKTSILVKGVRLLATCLWSYVPPESEDPVSKGLTDYQVIRIQEGENTRRATVEDTNKWHQEQVEWVREEIEKAKENKETVVVMTHHAPTFERTSHPKYKGNAIQPGFATDLEDLLTSPVAAWFFGHTHYNDPYFFNNNNNNDNNNNNNVLVSSNQVGYFAKGDRNGTFSTKYCVTIKEGKAIQERE